MADLLLLTSEAGGSARVLPALTLLTHRVRVVPTEPAALLDAPDSDVVLIDARQDLARARATCQLLRSTGIDVPVILVLGEGGLSVVRPDWGTDDIVLADAGPAEVDARLRLVAGRSQLGGESDDPEQIEVGDLTIDAGGYTARLRGQALDLTFKEFELLKYLSQHPGRVFTRAQLLQEVWGYDYFGGTRTVDVHIRRLRAKLGPEHDQMIGTVRNVGYRFDLPRHIADSAGDSDD
ncbi:response regulator transcription factor [Ruania alba]|uniref:DNA-binding response regulator, OmpR family, contains REC and winged-helix (WHTH) domain n=1 Tax=Ruania alba TaxID=648782 RepID=A0A1H5BA72_9MICO|nr:response regulator transcription factor [Ruania alba]SED51118.1 DNA-binding response regulator, OmpR family, contains REC and winged-helix (wHTH) domain [Ruania alba]